MKIFQSWGSLLLLLFIAGSLSAQQKKIVILHTNDVHSQIEPLPANDIYNPGMGGMVNRKAVVDSIRSVYEHVLLLDAGDIVQGTPYYNMFGGRAEIDAMNLIGYDAITIGNHEFDNGLDSLKMLFERASFPVVCSNYDFRDTPLKDLVKPYLIMKRFGLKIGILGIGVSPEGLIQKDKYKGMKFLPIAETANQYAELLKVKEKCDLVICLTHIGYGGDLKLVKQTRHIDLIIGGHSHTFLKEIKPTTDADGRVVPVSQAGKSGVFLGMYEVILN